ncbi:MAG: SAM-dependent methyltransferase [Lachnospiraceae bacterium]|nr:SAM-dependent methyltransferase [Lachnospiraceae bacterium]
MKPVVLSRRLQAVADMVTRANRVCDVGCDHGFVSIYLVEQGISPKVLAMDVRKGPLSAAAEHVAERGLGSQIETRLSDGLHNYDIGEADTLICAGMGGRLMMRILSEDWDKTGSFQEMILQPQSDIESFRRFLYEQGYHIAEENMIEEDGKFYPMMRVVKADALQELSDPAKVPDPLVCRYGPLLLKEQSQVLLSFLKREERIYGEILESLRTQGLSEEKRQARFAQVERLMEECRIAIAMIVNKES